MGEPVVTPAPSSRKEKTWAPKRDSSSGAAASRGSRSEESEKKEKEKKERQRKEQEKKDKERKERQREEKEEKEREERRKKDKENREKRTQRFASSAASTSSGAAAAPSSSTAMEVDNTVTVVAGQNGKTSTDIRSVHYRPSSEATPMETHRRDSPNRVRDRDRSPSPRIYHRRFRDEE